jgi:hypothetical protein
MGDCELFADYRPLCPLPTAVRAENKNIHCENSIDIEEFACGEGYIALCFFWQREIGLRRQPVALIQQAQPGAQEVAEQLDALAPAAPLAGRPPNIDIRRAVFFDWQAGQAACNFSCIE